jgi:hypothetical protein
MAAVEHEALLMEGAMVRRLVDGGKDDGSLQFRGGYYLIIGISSAIPFDSSKANHPSMLGTTGHGRTSLPLDSIGRKKPPAPS